MHNFTTYRKCIPAFTACNVSYIIYCMMYYILYYNVLYVTESGHAVNKPFIIFTSTREKKSIQKHI
jgi:uncharacterized membrane protein YesL